MKWSTSILLSLFCVCAVFPSVASAHESEEENNVIIVLHVNPNDSPVVGEKAGLKFLITGKYASFPSLACDCTGVVLDSGTELIRQKLFVHGELSDSIPYTFTHAGVYKVIVTGVPLQADSFKPFTIPFTVTVTDPTSATAQINSHRTYLYAGILTLCMLVIGYTYRKRVSTHLHVS